MQNYKLRIKNIKTIDKDLCKFMKVCKGCNELKLLILFQKESKLKDGYRNQCKICKAKGVKIRKDKIVVKCAYCGAEREIPPSKKSEHNFCNRECHDKW